jgi:hypothetical protein
LRVTAHRVHDALNGWPQLLIERATTNAQDLYRFREIFDLGAGFAGRPHHFLELGQRERGKALRGEGVSPRSDDARSVCDEIGCLAGHPGLLSDAGLNA